MTKVCVPLDELLRAFDPEATDKTVTLACTLESNWPGSVVHAVKRCVKDELHVDEMMIGETISAAVYKAFVSLIGDFRGDYYQMDVWFSGIINDWNDEYGLILYPDDSPNCNAQDDTLLALAAFVTSPTTENRSKCLALIRRDLSSTAD